MKKTPADTHFVTSALSLLEDIHYLNIEDVKGLEYIPTNRKCIIAANHSGWWACDGVILAYLLWRKGYGKASIVVNKWLLHIPLFRTLFSAGFDAIRPQELPSVLLGERNVQWPILIFPEGEEGNCKPFWQAYQTQTFQSGVRSIARMFEVDVIPVSIVGNEENAPVMCKSRWLEDKVGSCWPVPFLPIPLLFPVKWRFAFLPAIPYREKNLEEKLRQNIQNSLDQQASDRILYKFSKTCRRLQQFVKSWRKSSV